MKDRIPLYPGRVKLNPVSGQANTYDLTRADQPTQEGTPLNKATFLKDATAALYGLGTDAVPDDALHLLSRFPSGLGNEYIWAKSQYKEIKTSSTFSFLGKDESSILCSNQITLDSSGNISLSNPETYTFLQIQNNSSILKGKYVFYHPNSTYGDDRIKYIDETANIGFSTGGKTVSINVTSGGYIVSSQLEVVSYVNSPSSDAYPPAVSDGYTYVPSGQLGDKVRIATGSYTGTGTYGSSNPNSLTFDFEPKLVFMFEGNFPCYRNTGSSTTHPVYGTTIGMTTEYSKSLFNIYGQRSGDYYYLYAKKSIDGKTLSWYHEAGADRQMNNSGVTFNYIAIA